MSLDRPFEPTSSRAPLTGRSSEAADQPALPALSSIDSSPVTATLQRESKKGALWGTTPLSLDAAIGCAILPSCAREIALHRWRHGRASSFDPSTGLITIAGTPEPLRAHLFAREIEYHGFGCDLFFTRSNSSIFQQLSATTQVVLDELHRSAIMRGLDVFGEHALRERRFDIGPPLGRRLAGVAAELGERPLIALGVSREGTDSTHYEWFLVEESAVVTSSLMTGNESDDLRFFIDVIEECFPNCRALFTDPLAAVNLLGARFGLVTGYADDETLYVMAPTQLDVTGGRLALIVRTADDSARIPGLEICWAHHDPKPRPAATLYSPSRDGASRPADFR